MAPKNKVAEKVEEPAAKKAKVDDPPAEKPEDKEEKDAPADKRPAIKDQVSFDTADTTLNVIPSQGGKVLVSLADGGMQYLIAGARANVGIKKGRYMFEAKAIQATNAGGQGNDKAPKGLVLRVGFSTAGSDLVLGNSADGICFTNEGQLLNDKKKTKAGQTFGKDSVVAVVLNLEAGSPNENTISLFKDGKRCGPPKPLPENLKGKTLFPHVAFRNATVQVNFGSSPLKALPFVCRTVQSAASEDVKVTPSSAPKDGKYEVMYPVGFPDEGTFEWLDSYLEDKPQYVELSDRKILEWAKASGMWTANARSGKSSNDRPDFNFGLPGMEDRSIQKVIDNIAPLMPRNYVVMEVTSNLLEEDRKKNLQKFSAGCFKRVAHVVMGEPSKEWKAKVQKHLLKQKQEKSDKAFKAALAAKKAARQQRINAKKAAAAKKKAEEERKKRAEEAKKKAEEAKKKREEEAAKKKAEAEGKTEEKKEEKPAEPEKKEEEKKEEPKAEEEEPDEPEIPDEEPPKVELTDEEKKVNFLPKGGVKDVSFEVLNKSFGKFTVPQKAEGFDAVRYEWQDAKKANEYLRTWVLEKKRNSRVEDVKPGTFFTGKLAEFNKLAKEFQEKHSAFAAKKKIGKKEDASMAADIYSVENLDDIGNGEPLYSNFTWEDWVLMTLRYEIYLLARGWTIDVDDADRPGIPEEHFNFYYQKYFKKALNPKFYGKDSLSDLVSTLVKDTVAFDEKILTSKIEETDKIDIFVKLTEDNRRERQRRIDAGDETGRLKFMDALKPKTQPAKAQPDKKAATAPAEKKDAKADEKKK